MNIIVTGTSRGLGRDIVKQLAVESENKIIAVSRSEKRLKELEESSEYGNILPICIDINTEMKKPAAFLKSISATIDRVDILINNAGLLINKSFTEITDEDIQKMADTNFLSPLKLIRELFPLFSRGTHVVNISSMGGFQGSSKYRGLSVYSATKSALSSLTESLASEYSDSGISFNALALGAAQTEMLSEAFPGYKAPLSSNEMAGFICWFAMHGQKYFNGKILPVATSNP